MINAAKIELIVRLGELVIGKCELWIALGCLIQQLNGLRQALQLGSTKPRRYDECFGPYVQIMSGKIGRWFFFDRRFLLRGQIDLELRGDVCGNLGLQVEYVREIAIISLRP